MAGSASGVSLGCGPASDIALVLCQDQNNAALGVAAATLMQIEVVSCVDYNHTHCSGFGAPLGPAAAAYVSDAWVTG